MKITLHNLITCIVVFSATQLHATVLHDWQFNDPEGTVMSTTANQGTVGVAWDGNLANSSTTGTGDFRIRRNGTLTSRRADMGAVVVATEIHMITEISGWRMTTFTEGVINEIRWELLNGTTLNASTQVTTAYRLFFLPDGQVTLETGAGGTGSTRREAVPTFPAIQDEPVTLALSYNPIQQTYTVQYRIGNGQWVEFFRGDVAPDRSAVSFRIAVRGDFDGAGQNFFDMDRFVISTEFPPPAQDDPAPPPQTIAGNLHDWHFSDSAGTPLSETLNFANLQINWDGNLSDSATTGTGLFRIQRNSTLVNRRADMDDQLNSKEFHMQVDIAGWDLQRVDDPESQPEIRFELINAPAAEDSTQITAGMRLQRLETGEIALQAVASGLAAPGGQESDSLVVFTSIENGPLSLLTSYNSSEHHYAVYYRRGGGDWVEFFRGTTSGIRSAQSWRMALRGDFNGDGSSFFDIDRFVISNVFPAHNTLWELQDPIPPNGVKSTFIGELLDRYPWFYHLGSESWIYAAPTVSVADYGVYLYHFGMNTWLWTQSSLAGWAYAYQAEPQWINLQ